MRWRHKILFYCLGLFFILYLGNASWIAGPGRSQLSILSHRGVHQTFSSDNLDRDTCTAERIHPPTHQFLENTIAGFRAARNYGADEIELDVHPTTDGEFVVFHDWTLDCRSDGQGTTRDHSLDELQALDIGYGYTADGGETFPFRGQFVGAMPTLNDVLYTFQNSRFQINIKSRSKEEAEAILAYVDPDNLWRLGFVGHPDPINVIRSNHPDIKTVTRQDAKACLKGYILTGWYGGVPKACHDSYVPVPINYRRLLWGWPHRFERRLNSVGSRSMLIGPMKDGNSTGVDRLEQLKAIPEDYTGIVVTNKIEEIGPALRRRGQSDE